MSAGVSGHGPHFGDGMDRIVHLERPGQIEFAFERVVVGANLVDRGVDGPLELDAVDVDQRVAEKRGKALQVEHLLHESDLGRGAGPLQPQNDRHLLAEGGGVQRRRRPDQVFDVDAAGWKILARLPRLSVGRPKDHRNKEQQPADRQRGSAHLHHRWLLRLIGALPRHEGGCHRALDLA
jgi:hypothetical protein